jgi:hypothetical protein
MTEPLFANKLLDVHHVSITGDHPQRHNPDTKSRPVSLSEGDIRLRDGVDNSQRHSEIKRIIAYLIGSYVAVAYNLPKSVICPSESISALG